MENIIVNTENPHLKLVHYETLLNCIITKKLSEKSEIHILDIGGGRGYGNIFDRRGIKYHVLDLNLLKNSEKISYIQGDITDKNLELPKFDLIFTKDTFEHILNPWDSTDNIANSLEEGGIFFFIAPFSWRYHSSPYDSYRYTHTGAQYIFERNGRMRKLHSGYQYIDAKTSGFWKNKKDFTMNKNIFNECIETIYVGEKDSNHVFCKSNLDSDFSNDHSN
jgi:SAM-dependent methyltransferase